jgi:hypothetical protein
MPGLGSNETGTLAQVQKTAQMRTKPYATGESGATRRYVPSPEGAKWLKSRADRDEMNAMAYDWAYHGAAVKEAFPGGYAGNNPGTATDRTAYAYWVIEDAITDFVRSLGATTGYRRYWSERLRPMMAGYYRDGHQVSDAERGLIGKVLARALRIHLERSKPFEEAA